MCSSNVHGSALHLLDANPPAPVSVEDDAGASAHFVQIDGFRSGSLQRVNLSIRILFNGRDNEYTLTIIYLSLLCYL